MGDAAHLAHKLIDIEHSDAILLMLGMESKVLIIGRSRVPEINVAKVLEQFGGGGHPTAASATVKERPLELLEEELKAALQENVKPGKFAADVMTRPVITIDIEKTIKDAEKEMTKFGVNVLPVLRGPAFMGLISREVVEKSIFHGFALSGLSDFMTQDAQTAQKYTPVKEVERAMIENNQRFMPVLDRHTIIGAITRTDILRAMYDEYLRRSNIKGTTQETRAAVKKNLTSWINNRYPGHVSRLIKLSGEVASGLGFSAYLVGGSVRDLLRDEENLDIDIVIEGDGIVFAEKLALKLGARVNTHKRFATAKVITDEMRIDIATARTEYYESPAALPKVQMSSIK
jgi:tRNA nucleotidyltransferase (CCA-adding enzyme)